MHCEISLNTITSDNITKFSHLETLFTFTIITVSGVHANLAAIPIPEEALVNVSFTKLFVFVSAVAAIVVAVAQLGH